MKSIYQWVIGSAITALLVTTAFAADPLPDRRAPRPTAVPITPATAPAAVPTTNEALADLLGELEALQAQVRELRGQLEVQTNEVERLKKRQQDVSTDFDRRLREMEKRGSGSAASSGNSEGPSLVVTPPTNSVTPPATTKAAAPTATEQQQYDAAFALMKQGMYEQAAKSFREFVASNPRSALAGNAQYWVGEAAYVSRDFRGALEEFTKVVEGYPQSSKVPDALLKIGYAQQELGATDKARAALQDLVTRFPNTTVAKVAEQRLQKLAPAAR